MAPGIGLALRRVLGGDEHRPLGVCREWVGDAAKESTADGPPAALAADNQASLIKRKGVDYQAFSVDAGGGTRTPKGITPTGS